jgi:hypothetical protein
MRQAGMIVKIADPVLCYDNHSEHTQFTVTCLGKQSMILGYNWLCTQKVKASQINACQSGAFFTMIEELDDQDKSPHLNMSETGEEVQDESLAFDDDLNFDADNVEIKEGDRVFMVMVHPVDSQHFIHALSMVSGHLAKAFAKNLMQKGFHNIVPTALHSNEDVFNETAFKTLPEHQKWDHAI